MSHGDTSVSFQQAIINQDTSHLALNATRHGDTSVAIQQAIINQDTSHLDLNTTRGHSVAIQQAIINQDRSHLDLNTTRGHKRSYPTSYYQPGHVPPGSKCHTGTQAQLSNLVYRILYYTYTIFATSTTRFFCKCFQIPLNKRVKIIIKRGSSKFWLKRF